MIAIRENEFDVKLPASTPDPGRDLGTAAELVSSVADALGTGRFALIGHSGGGSAELHKCSIVGCLF